MFWSLLIVGLILIAIVGPVMDAMRMVRGYSRGIFATIFSTVILNLLIWGIGAFVLALAVSILADFLLQNRIQETGDEDVTHIDSSNNKLRLLEENNNMLVYGCR